MWLAWLKMLATQALPIIMKGVMMLVIFIEGVLVKWWIFIWLMGIGQIWTVDNVTTFPEVCFEQEVYNKCMGEEWATHQTCVTNAMDKECLTQLINTPDQENQQWEETNDTEASMENALGASWSAMITWGNDAWWISEAMNQWTGEQGETGSDTTRQNAWNTNDWEPHNAWDEWRQQKKSKAKALTAPWWVFLQKMKNEGGAWTRTWTWTDLRSEWETKQCITYVRLPNNYLSWEAFVLEMGNELFDIQREKWSWNVLSWNVLSWNVLSWGAWSTMQPVTQSGFLFGVQDLFEKLGMQEVVADIVTLSYDQYYEWYDSAMFSWMYASPRFNDREAMTIVKTDEWWEVVPVYNESTVKEWLSILAWGSSGALLPQVTLLVLQGTLYGSQDYTIHVQYSWYTQAIKEWEKIQEQKSRQEEEKVVFIGDDREYNDTIPEDSEINPREWLLYTWGFWGQCAWQDDTLTVSFQEYYRQFLQAESERDAVYIIPSLENQETILWETWQWELPWNIQENDNDTLMLDFWTLWEQYSETASGVNNVTNNNNDANWQPWEDNNFCDAPNALACSLRCTTWGWKPGECKEMCQRCESIPPLIVTSNEAERDNTIEWEENIGDDRSTEEKRTEEGESTQSMQENTVRDKTQQENTDRYTPEIQEKLAKMLQSYAQLLQNPHTTMKRQITTRGDACTLPAIWSCLEQCMIEGGDIQTCQKSCISCLPPAVIRSSLANHDSSLFEHYFVDKTNFVGKDFLEVQHEIAFVDTKDEWYRAQIPAWTAIVAPEGDVMPTDLVLIPYTSWNNLEQLSRVDLRAQEQVVTVSSMKFGSEEAWLHFSTPVQLTMPVPWIEDGTQLTVLMTHAGELWRTPTGITTHPDAVCLDGIPSIEDNLVTVSDGSVTFYTCRASDFTVDMNFDPSPNGIVHAITVQADGKFLVWWEFTTIAWNTRNRLARFNANGTLDTGFNPNVNNTVFAITELKDWSIIIGGDFTSVSSTTVNRLAKLDDSWTLDTNFHPDVNDTVYTILESPIDDSIIFGGAFTIVWLTARNRIASVWQDGSLQSFDPNVNGIIYTIAYHEKTEQGYIVWGKFNEIVSTSKNRIARLDASGGLDTSFTASANNDVRIIVVNNSNSTILLWGAFTSVSSTSRTRLARLNWDGSLDTWFNPSIDTGAVYTIKEDRDGNIYFWGTFTSVDSMTRNRGAALRSDGSSFTVFNPNANNDIYALAIQESDTDQVLLWGNFTTIGWENRNRLARFGVYGIAAWSFTINWGAQYTTSTTVTLSITCPPSWDQVAFGNTDNPSSWETCTSSKTHTLTSGDGLKRVYMRWRDSGTMVMSSVISQDITLDTTAPVTTDNANNTWRNTDFTVTLTPNEAWTTTYCVDTAWSCTPSTAWTTVNVTCAAWTTCGSQYVRYRTTDTAWNVEAIKTSAQIRIDKQTPVWW